MMERGEVLIKFDDLPGGQGVHFVEESKPSAKLYVFDEQFLQALTFIAAYTSPYFPAPHGLHDV